MNETSNGFLAVIIDYRCLLFPLHKRCFVFELFLYHNAHGYSLQHAELFRVGLVVLEHELLHPCFQLATVPVGRYLAHIMSSVDWFKLTWCVPGICPRMWSAYAYATNKERPLGTCVSSEVAPVYGAGLSSIRFSAALALANTFL